MKKIELSGKVEDRKIDLYGYIYTMNLVILSNESKLRQVYTVILEKGFDIKKEELKPGEYCTIVGDFANERKNTLNPQEIYADNSLFFKNGILPF